jgi:retron-type reverse transcriptase
MGETPGSQTVSTKLRRIAEQAKAAPDMAFTTLAHHIDVDWLREAYRRTRKDGATGVDGQSADEYAANLEQNLRSLLERAKSGTYRAPPVRRVHIPKGDGTQRRPIGIPTFEDKILQRAVTMLLEAIYEQDFHDFSYGFRPRRSAHQALETLQNSLAKMAGGWVLEVDLRKFFDTLNHERLREILRRRVRDGVVLRLIGKWLNAGVLEGLELSYPDAGTPQGSSRRCSRTSTCMRSLTSGSWAKCSRGLRAARCSCATRTISSSSSHRRETRGAYSRSCRSASSGTA